MKKSVRVVSAVVCGAMVVSLIPLAACGSGKSSLVIMSEELSGLFNPFYATTGADQDIIGMTQIGMLTTDSDGNVTCGEDEATVCLDYEVVENGDGQGNTVYRFVIKNGLTFSDGTPLTMNDVMFNLYEYLDPVYTGSSTMYSTEIVGLNQYRTQTYSSSGTYDDNLDVEANGYAIDRIDQLIDVYQSEYEGSSSSKTYRADEAEMKKRISEMTVFNTGYYIATGIENGDTEAARTQLLADYEFTLKSFREELEDDYISAKESFDTTSAPYNSNAEIAAAIDDPKTGDVFKFMLFEGYVTVEYDVDPDTHKKDTSNIKSFSYSYDPNEINTQDKAIERVYNDTVEYKLDEILSYWGTRSTLLTAYAAEYTGRSLQANIRENGDLLYPYIDGIVSLGHQRKVYSSVAADDTDYTYEWPYSDSTVTVNGKSYKIAKNHNADGTPVNEDEYDVLQITVEDVDPKAIYNFSFTVAPQSYYATNDAGVTEAMKIEDNEFGVRYADYSFQSDVIQSELHNGVPMGAGPYKATNSKNDENGITKSSFWSAGNVFFKANSNFMFDVKEENIIFLEVSSTNAIDKLKNGEVDYAVPQFTKTNSEELNKMKKIKTLDAWQLGYGYIGINAGKVTNRYLRYAIMSAMNVSLALEYYYPGQAETIYWPMSKVSWAYPTNTNNGRAWTQWTSNTEEQAIEKIKGYMDQAMNIDGGYSDSDLKITLTISGSSISEHPTYQVFLQAMELLNECGWDVEIKADAQALTKLATGSLTVWAAAWGSTIDPDMYQVYHFNSTATSTYAWGYREIKNKPESWEYDLIKNTLSPAIDAGRQTNNQEERAAIYETAMGYVLDLAIELPVYQRKTLYAYNTSTVGGLNEEVNPYSSPLERIWEVYLIK